MVKSHSSCLEILSEYYFDIFGNFNTQTKGKTVFAKLNGLMNDEMEKSFILGMQHFSHIVPGFDRKDAILSGMETRTSSPVRMIRNENLESNIRGMYPCGKEQVMGGITSAAIDGIKVAEAIVKNTNLINRKRGIQKWLM